VHLSCTLVQASLRAARREKHRDKDQLVVSAPVAARHRFRKTRIGLC